MEKAAEPKVEKAAEPEATQQVQEEVKRHRAVHVKQDRERPIPVIESYPVKITREMTLRAFADLLADDTFALYLRNLRGAGGKAYSRQIADLTIGQVEKKLINGEAGFVTKDNEQVFRVFEALLK